MGRIVPLSAFMLGLGLIVADASLAQAQFRAGGFQGRDHGRDQGQSRESFQGGRNAESGARGDQRGGQSFQSGQAAPDRRFGGRASEGRASEGRTAEGRIANGQRPERGGPRYPGRGGYDRGPRYGFYDGNGFGVPIYGPGYYYARPRYYDPDDADDEVIYRRPRRNVEILDDGPIQRDRAPQRKPKKTVVTKRPPQPPLKQQASAPRPPAPPIVAPPNVAPPAPPPVNTAADIPSAPASGVPPVGEQRYVPDEVVFEFKPEATPQSIDDVIARNQLERVASWRFRLTDSIIYRYRITDGRSVSTVVAALEQDGNVRAAQPNYIYTLQQPAVAESQPAAPDSGALKPSEVPQATRASSASGLPPQYAIEVMHVADAHKLANGASIIVSVIDSGIDTTHPEVSGVVSEAFDPIGGEARPDAHGTAMTGAIAAHGQLTGLAPQAHVVSVRAFAGAGQQPPAKAGTEGTTFHILRGLDWSYEKQARIVNMSFAGPKDPALSRMMAAARMKKMILFAAAGNAGPNSAPLYPAADPNVIAVTATDAQNQPYQNANRGSYISVAAPGVDVLVAAPNGGYSFTTGTSVATAHVSGLAALLLQRQPALDQEDIRKLLVSSGKPIGAGNSVELVDAAAAVSAAEGTR